DAFFSELKGGTSGGTLASAIDSAEAMQRDPALRRVFADPYSLVPGGSGPDRTDMEGPRYEPRLQRWTAPFVMAAINAPIVRRSNALLDYRYGREFRYSERSSMAGGAKGWLTSTAMTAGLVAFTGALAVTPLRTVIRKRVPQPGQGPTPEQRAAGR